ncbi:MAG: hypothetical protein C0597_07950, partial [Marinilabiliales bacterium]
MRKIIVFVLLIGAMVSCNHANKQEKVIKPTVTVSILPQKYLVERIVGNHFDVNVMIPPGASPVSYEPTPKHMKELSNSDVYIRIGHIEFEKAWMKNIQNINPDMRIIDQSENAELIFSEENHDHNSDHHHHGIDPHIWTSPKEVKKQAEFIYNYFISNYPELELEINKSYAVFQDQQDSLDLYLQRALKPYQGRKFL